MSPFLWRPRRPGAKQKRLTPVSTRGEAQSSTVPPCLHARRKPALCASRAEPQAKPFQAFAGFQWRRKPLMGFPHTPFLSEGSTHVKAFFRHRCAARVLCNGRSRPGLHIGGQLQGGDCSGPGKRRLQPEAASLCCAFRTASFSKPFLQWIQYSTGNFDCQGAGGLNFPPEIPVFSTFSL